MTDATCPVCGTQCRIAGDPSSVTRWYEPVGQAELDAAKAAGGKWADACELEHGQRIVVEGERDTANLRIEELKEHRRKAVDAYMRVADERDALTLRIIELKQRIKDLEGALDKLLLMHGHDKGDCLVCDNARAALSSDAAATEAVLCICGHPLSTHDVGGLHSGCCQLDRVNGIIRRYCDCDMFTVGKVAE